MPEDEVNSAGGDAEAPEAGHPESGRETLRARQRPGPPPPGELAGHFPQLDILEVLGEGGMGYVYKARQKGLDRLVALKLLPQDISTDRNFAERFAREARALARLNHASIVTVYDSGQIGKLYYFIMEYVDGLNLRELLNRGDGRVETDQALRIVGSVCDALDYAHEEGVVHRDIKPENILLDTKGRIKIADFGLAKLLGGGDDRQSSLTMGSPHQMLGTPHYMAPEQTERPLEVDHRADIYAIGVVFYEMLTGELPLGRFPLPSEMGRGDAVLDDIVVKALEKRPERRFQRASDVKLAVESALSGVGPAPEPAGPDRVVTPPVEPVPAPGAGTTYPSGRYQRVNLDTAFRMVRWPSYAMIAAGVLTVLGLSPAGIVMIIGGMWMRQLRARGMALAAGIVAVLPLSAFWFPVTMAAGAWVLYIVNRREIVAAFEAVASARRQRP